MSNQSNAIKNLQSQLNRGKGVQLPPINLDRVTVVPRSGYPQEVKSDED